MSISLQVKIFFFFYSLLLLCLFLYSFTQVDLSLTLSRVSIWQSTQKGLQYVGYFQRPLSMQLFIIIVAFLYGGYVVWLKLASEKKLTEKFVKILIVTSTILLIFSYNAFSHDLFNYMFDAKIFTYYNKNPYLHKALDFPQDPYLSFMHWTHRVYPYGPVWLVVSIFLSFMGLHYFLPTFFLFKLFIGACYLGTVYFLYKTASLVFPQHRVFIPLFFALQPLVLIESLVSAHNDIVMMFLASIAVYFLLRKRYIWAFVFLLLSIGIKFATIFLLPLFFVFLIMNIARRPMLPSQFFFLSILFMTGAVVAATLRTNFQPWYLLYFLPFAAFLANKYYIGIPSSIVSLAGVLLYVPFLATGNWDPPIPEILNILMKTSILVAICAVIGIAGVRYIQK